MLETVPPPIQRHDVTDLLLRKLARFNRLNPKIQPGENPTLKRNKVYAKKIQSIVNQSNIVEFYDGKGENVDLFQLSDKKKQKLPILVKIVKPDRQDDADRVESTHKLCVDLLGPEFVEDATRITVINKQILLTYKNGKYKNRERLEGFVQDLRGLDHKESLYKYLLGHDYTLIPQNQRFKIKLFFEKVIEAFQKGYAIDLGVFPESLSDMEETDFRANLLIDLEGVSIIDTGVIFKIPGDSMWKLYFQDLQIACQLFAGKINQQQAFEAERNSSKNLDKMNIQTLKTGLKQLTDLLETIK